LWEVKRQHCRQGRRKAAPSSRKEEGSIVVKEGRHAASPPKRRKEEGSIVAREASIVCRRQGSQHRPSSSGSRRAESGVVLEKDLVDDLKERM